MNKDLSWIKELENPGDAFDKDVKLVFENWGIDTTIQLLEKVASVHLYLSTASITKAQREYIRIHFDGNNAKDLALKLGCSEKHVYAVNNYLIGVEI